MPNLVSKSSSSDRLAWPILLLLLTVSVPSIGVVWMMREAVRNEQLATSQRLRELYELQLQTSSETLQENWLSQLENLDDPLSSGSPALAFQSIVEQGFCDSVLIRDETGRVVYPDQTPATKTASMERGPDWIVAERLEFSERKFAEAAQLYERLAKEAEAPLFRATAKQAQVRNLLKADDKSAAIQILQEMRLQEINDLQGRSIPAAAELRLLEILERDTEAWNEVADSLSKRIGDYSRPSMNSAQRRFLMSMLRELDSERFSWPTQQAEGLAAKVLPVWDDSLPANRMLRTGVPDLWMQSTASGRVVLLLHTEMIREQLLEMGQDIQLASGVELHVSPEMEDSEYLAEIEIGEAFGDWRLGLKATEGDPRDAKSEYRNAIHLWITMLIVAMTCILAWLLWGTLRRSWQLANLKNDLVATVSHELKTPLASIRLLVDTLLESEDDLTSASSAQKVREYLELISHENARLTRLIDNFLKFSRLERGKQRFDFRVIDIRSVVVEAAQVFREHWDGADHCLHVEQGTEVFVLGDLDALVSAVVNLLENAWKYSGEEKEIRLSATAIEDRIEISVSDNGIGLSSRAAARVFDRFYQVDQRVARSHEGCGLGLSIVRAIIQAHGGEARVQSQLNRGSTFTLSLPKYDASAHEIEPQLVQGSAP